MVRCNKKLSGQRQTGYIVLGNRKTSLSGAYHALDFAKYGSRYLAAFAHRFNRRFHLETFPGWLLVATLGTLPPSRRRSLL